MSIPCREMILNNCVYSEKFYYLRLPSHWNMTSTKSFAWNDSLGILGKSSMLCIRNTPVSIHTCYWTIRIWNFLLEIQQSCRYGCHSSDLLTLSWSSSFKVIKKKKKNLSSWVWWGSDRSFSSIDAKVWRKRRKAEGRETWAWRVLFTL